MGYAEALWKIEQAKKTGATELDFSWQRLTELPSELFQLTSLTMLNLSNNRLISLPSKIIHLTNLTELCLQRNRLVSLPLEIGHLSKLIKLYFGGNQITSLPSEIGHLTNLAKLYLGGNQLTSLPSQIVHLSNLTTLDLSGNQLTSLPSEIGQLTNLITLDLWGNPLTSPPYELATQGIEAIREYFASAEEGTRTVAEVKVILVGEGASGKTSLTRCLREERFNAHEETTHGIRIKNWQLNSGDQSLRCNLWDFGGQEIMHATHQFFLSRRSLYVLVLDGRRDERPEYWLRYIESFGGGSPVLVVLNKYDTNPGFDLNRPFLKKKYPFIVDFFRTSCRTGNGIQAFKQALLEKLVYVPMVHTRWPGSWFRVKAEFEQMNEPCISYERFTETCTDAGVNEASKQDVLAGFLHDLGIVIHFTDFGLDENHVLDPKWITGAVYKIINAESVATGKGCFRLDALKEILRWQEGDPYIYKRADHRYIIELMKKFEFCYELAGGEVLIPQLLAVPQPLFEFPYQSALCFLLLYTDFLPPSVMPRFIVKRHKEIKDELRWRTGVVLEHPALEATAVVRADNEARRIQIMVNGTERKVFLALIWLTFRELHTGFEGLKVSERIPLPDNPRVSIAYETLLNYAEQEMEKIIPEGTDKAYSVRELLEGVHFDSPSESERMIVLAEGERKGEAMNQTGSALNTIFKLEPSVFGVGINLNAVFDFLLRRKKK